MVTGMANHFQLVCNYVAHETIDTLLDYLYIVIMEVNATSTGVPPVAFPDHFSGSGLLGGL